MKDLKKFLLAGAAACALMACSSGPTRFGIDLTDDDQGLILNAENAGKGTAAGSGVTVNEGETVVVSGDITSGSVLYQMINENEETAAEFTFDAAGQEAEFELAPGEYMAKFTAEQNKTNGTVTMLKKASEAAAADEGQNPVMNFVGTYAAGRAAILVEAEGDQDAKFSITWGNSAAEHSEWTMKGTFDAETMSVAYTDAVRKNVVFKEDGTVDSETVVYEDGTGTFTFDGATLIWADETEHAADDMVFEYAN